MTQGTESAPQPRTTYRGLVKSSAIYSIGTYVARVVSFVFVPVYTNQITRAEYAVLELLDLTVQALSMFFLTRFSGSVSYYFASAKTPREKGLVVSTGIIGSMVVALLFLGTGILVSGVLSNAVFGTREYQRLLIVMVVAFATTMPAEVGLEWFRSSDRPIPYVVATTFKLLLQLGLIILFLFYYKLGLASAPWSTLGAQGGTAIIVVGYCIHKFGWRLDLGVLKKMMHYSGPTVLIGACLFVMHFGDRFLLQRYASLSEVGVYALAYKIGMMIAFVLMPFQLHWGSISSRVILEPGGEDVFAKTFTYLTLTGSLMSLGIIVTTPLYVALMPKEYHDAIALIPLITGGYLLRSLGDHLRSVLFSTGRTGLDAIVHVVSLITAVASYFLLIPRYHAMGAAGATALTFLAFLISSWILMERTKPIPVEKARLATVAALTVAIYFAYLLTPFGIVGKAVVGSALVLGFVPALWALKFFTGAEIAKGHELLQMGQMKLGSYLGRQVPESENVGN